MHGPLSNKAEIIVAEVPIMALPSLLTGATSEHRGRAVKSRGPLTERNPSLSKYSGRRPSPDGSGCGAPNESNETSPNSGSVTAVWTKSCSLVVYVSGR